MASHCPCCGDLLPPVRWGDLSVSLDDGAAWRGRRFRLSPQRLALLHHLVRRAPGTVRKEALILSSLNEDVVENMLTTQVSYLNKALRDHGVPLRVANDFGIGYRLEELAPALADA